VDGVILGGSWVGDIFGPCLEEWLPQDESELLSGVGRVDFGMSVVTAVSGGGGDGSEGCESELLEHNV